MFPDVLIPAGLVLAIDQASKSLILTRRGSRRPARPNGFRPQLRPVLNKPIGLRLIADRRAVLILWGLVVLGMLLLVQYEPAFHTPSARLALGAALGGATGNLIDWLRGGAVIDFIDLRFWPVFNLADVFIVVGVGAVLWSIR